MNQLNEKKPVPGQEKLPIRLRRWTTITSTIALTFLVLVALQFLLSQSFSVVPVAAQTQSNNLLDNGDFQTGSLTPWGEFGDVTLVLDQTDYSVELASIGSQISQSFTYMGQPGIHRLSFNQRKSANNYQVTTEFELSSSDSTFFPVTNQVTTGCTLGCYEWITVTHDFLLMPGEIYTFTITYHGESGNGGGNIPIANVDNFSIEWIQSVEDIDTGLLQNGDFIGADGWGYSGEAYIDFDIGSHDFFTRFAAIYVNHDAKISQTVSSPYTGTFLFSFDCVQQGHTSSPQLLYYEINGAMLDTYTSCAPSINLWNTITHEVHLDAGEIYTVLFDMRSEAQRTYYHLDNISLIYQGNELEDEMITAKESSSCEGFGSQLLRILQRWTGDPINSHNGNMSVQALDLAIPVAGCRLEFFRSYASQNVDFYTSTMGHGWTHNYDMQLHFDNTIFPDSVDLQIGSGSRLPFIDHGDGTYSPYSGVTGGMVWDDPYYILTGSNQKVYTFDSDGRILTQTNPLGNDLTFTYYITGPLQEVRQGDRYLTYFYEDVNGDYRLTSVEDHSGREVSLTYNDDNELIRVTDPLSRSTHYTYTIASNGTYTYPHLLFRETDPSGRVVEETAYDDQGRAYRQWDGEGNLLVDIDYSQPDVQTVMENGVTMSHSYDGRNVLIGSSYSCSDGTPGCGTGESINYDGNFRHDDVQDANNNPTNLEWDESGTNIEYVQNGLGQETFMSYDQYNNLTETLDARGNRTQYFYNNPQFPTFLTKMTDALGNSTLYTTTTAADGVPGLLKETQDANGRLATYTYNAYGQVTQSIQAVGTTDAVTTTYGYDALGRLQTTTATSAAESHTSLNVYDAGDQLIATIQNWTGSNPTTWENECIIPATSSDENVCTRYRYDAAGRTISTTNALDQTSVTFYDDASRPFLSVRNYTYPADPLAIIDPVSTVCNFSTPDPEFNLCSLTEFDDYGRVAATTDSIGRVTRTEYDSLGRVKGTIVNSVNVTSLAGCAFPPAQADRDLCTMYQYDAVGNTTIVTDSVGHMNRTFYDALNRVEGTINNWDGSTNLAQCQSLPRERDDNICTQYQYDEVGNTIFITNTLTQTTRTFYDELNRVEATVENWQPGLDAASQCNVSPDNTAAENICTLFGYDEAGNQITVTNALSQTSLTVYDAANRPYLSVQNWDGSPITSEADCSFPPASADTNVCSVTYFDALGRTSASKDPLGHLTEVGYDGLGRTVTTTRYLDQSPITNFQSYDALGNRLSSTDAEGSTATFEYDSLNRLERTISAEGVVSEQDYNAVSWVLQQRDGLDNATITTYDLLGRPLTMTDPESNVTTYEYDALGNQTAMIDAESVRTTYEYDELNRLVAVIENDVPGDNPSHETDVKTEYVYDALGNRTFITNARGLTTSLTIYDNLNRPVVVQDALGNETLTDYNALGLRTVMTDGNEAVTSYEYDDLNRLTTTNYQADGEIVTYDYNAVGNRLQMEDGIGTTTYQYDDLYRLVTVTNPFTGTVVYGYDNVGNRTSLTYPDDKMVTYVYDDDNRLDTVTDWDAGTTTHEYDPAGRLITTTLPNGVQTVNSYDDANRLTRLTHVDSANATLLANYQYELDGLGNRVVATETVRSAGSFETLDWYQTAKIQTFDGNGGSEFGNSVAVSGDTAVMGASTGTWAAYVLTYDGQDWNNQVRIVSSYPGAVGNYDTSSVAIDDDTIVLGSRFIDRGGYSAAGGAFVFARSGMTWTQQAILTPTIPTQAGDDCGLSVAVSEDTILVGCPKDDSLTTNAGGVYVYTWDGSDWNHEATLRPDSGTGSVQFGTSVALDGDTAVISAPYDDEQASNAGAIYIFQRSGTTWTQQAKLEASDGGADDRLGQVAISSDYVVAGTNRNDYLGTDAGAAYVFHFNGSSWSETDILHASDGAAGDHFGQVAIKGENILVGSGEHDGSGVDSGASYLFALGENGWTEVKKLMPLDAVAAQESGTSVALLEDTLFIGADKVETSNQGAVYIYEYTSLQTAVEQDKIHSNNAAVGDYFGNSLAVSGDTAVVGANLADTETVANAGTVTVLAFDGQTWAEQTVLTATDGAAADNFGVSVAINGDIVVVGANSHDVSGITNTGAAYVFVRDSPTWTQQIKLTAPITDANELDRFGSSVAVDGDTILVGAPYDDESGTNNGAVYVFTWNGITWTQEAKITNNTGARFGRSLALDGDTALIGESNLEKAFIYTRSGTTWTLAAELQAAAAPNGFGNAVALLGNTAVVATSTADDLGTSSGAVTLFEHDAGTWSEEITLLASDGEAGDHFGTSLALTEDGLLIGARDHDNGRFNDAGAAYLFLKVNGVWTETLKLQAMDPAGNDGFGRSVGLSGDSILIGADEDDDFGSNAGAVYHFDTLGSEANSLGLETTIITYAYDPLYRLTGAVYTGAITATYSYVYDAVGNMDAFTETVGANTSVVNRSFNDANQLVTSSDAALGTTSFTYDDNGNLIDIYLPGFSEEHVLYSYNQRNLLTEVAKQYGIVGPDVEATYVYDGDSNRLQQIDHNGGITTTYTNDVVGLAQVLLSDDGTTQTAVLFGLDLIQQDDGSQTRTLLADGLGSARTEMVGSSVESTTTYEPYGKMLAQSGTVYGYTGEQYDALTGLVYLRARYYNPSLKTFQSRDPFPGYTTLAISQNGYAYVHANPVNLTDPSGEIAPLLVAALFVGGYVVGDVAATTWDVMVVQGRGGIDNVRSMAVFNRCHYENVNWEQAEFMGDMGGFIGAAAAPTIYFLGSAVSSGVGSGLNRLGVEYLRRSFQMQQLANAHGAVRLGLAGLGVLDTVSDTYEGFNAWRHRDQDAMYLYMLAAMMPLINGTVINNAAEGSYRLFDNKFPDHEIGVPSIIPLDRLRQVSLRNLNYVVLEDGTLIVGKKNDFLPGGGHIDLADGKPVLAAGELRVVKGEIRWMDNSSGHYEPFGLSAQHAAEAAFQKAGFDTNGVYIEKVWKDGKWIPIE